MEIITAFKKSRVLQGIVGLLLLLLLVVYFRIFFTTGIIVDDTFLKKTIRSSEIDYTGKSEFGTLEVTVQGHRNKDSTSIVTYHLPNQIYRQFTVQLVDGSDWSRGITSISDSYGKSVDIIRYTSEEPFLYDVNGEPMIDINGMTYFSGENPYENSYKVNLKNVADTATYSRELIRGNYVYLIFAVILIGFTLIDIRFPLFFFHMRYALSVDNPEPTDWYLFLQKVAWHVYPAVIFMIAAL
jgi:hypothetical protein